MLSLQKLGALTAHNFLITLSPCSMKQQLHNLTSLKLQAFKRLALDLSFRSLSPEELATVLSKLEKKQIYIALPLALRYIRKQRQKIQPDVWEQIKMIMCNIDTNKKAAVKLLMKIDGIPDNIQGEYSFTVYNTVKKIGLTFDSEMDFKALKGILQCIVNNLASFDDKFINEINSDFIKIGLEEKSVSDCYIDQCISTFFKILSKSLLLCKSDEQQAERFEKFAQPVLAITNRLWTNYLDNGCDDTYVMKHFLIFLRNLKMTNVFMDSTYVSPIPVYEKILLHIKQYLPMEKYFKLYTYIHLSMLFYKTVRRCVKQWPDIIDDKKMKNVLNIEKIGIVYGRYIAYEIKQLVSTYFESIQWMYADIFITYIHEYFSYGKAVQIFKTSIIKGLLEDKHNHNALFFAVLLYKKLYYAYEEENDLQQIFEFVKELDNKQIQFYFNISPKYI